MPRCPTCGARSEKKGVCSTACKRERLKLKRIQAERRARFKRWDQTRPLFCTVCGKRLRAPGRYCTNHRGLYMRQYMKEYRRRKNGEQEARTNGTA
jgi:predicted nucleic acid-binding Zn ribbon protein